MRFPRWLTQELPQRKRALRHRIAGIAAYYWDGGAPKEHLVRDISLTGAYVCATESWYIGTILTMTLRYRVGEEETALAEVPVISIPCKVVRQDPDGGVGVKFMFAGKEEHTALEKFIKQVMGKPHSKGKGRGNEGQALVEYAFMVPFLFLLIVNAVNFGSFIYTWITVANAARAGVQYAVLAGASAGSFTAATGTQVSSIITNDMASLPGTPTVAVCKCSGTATSPCPSANVTALSGTCSSVPNDPEAPLYVLTTVDVTYTYTPLIPALNFTALGIHATIPPTSIHRRAVMRSIQ